jgi:hypothetical protein
VYSGNGRSARIGPGTDRRGIRGARLVVRADPAEALQYAITALRGARFALDTTPRQPRLMAAAAPWVAQALTIGRPARGLWASTPMFEYGDFPMNMIPLFWPRVALTLAIACARNTDAGTELVIYAHPSMLRAGDRTNDSGPLLARAYTALQRRFGSSGVLLHHEPLDRVTDDGCPASAPFVRRQLDWS